MLNADETLLVQAAFAALRGRYVESGQTPPAGLDALMEKLQAMEPRLTFAQASVEFGIAPSTLRYAALDGWLEAEKTGRDWSTMASAVEEALAEGWIHRRPGRPRKQD